ncbi:MAG: hypothetical protein LBB22_02395 [Treponema sp.]|nr:hypothetical protein [Treponema sp.]
MAEYRIKARLRAARYGDRGGATVMRLYAVNGMEIAPPLMIFVPCGEIDVHIKLPLNLLSMVKLMVPRPFSTGSLIYIL